MNTTEEPRKPLELPEFEWSLEDSVRYEVAIEILNQRIGTAMARIYEEEAKPDLNRELLQKLNTITQEASKLVQTLQPEDHAALSEIESAAKTTLAEIESM